MKSKLDFNECAIGITKRQTTKDATATFSYFSEQFQNFCLFMKVFLRTGVLLSLQQD